MNLSNLISTSWFKNYSNWLPLLQWASWILVVFILAKVFWVWALYFTTPSEIEAVRVTPGSVSKTTSKVEINELLKLNLFGSAEVAKAAPITEEVAPETKLNLKLRGIYAADTQSKANAIIEDGRGKQAVYFIDEKLEVSGRVFLRQVYFDKVILETNGKKETLKLETQESAFTVSDKSNAKKTELGKQKVQDKRNNQRISQQLNKYRDKLARDPQSVMEVISPRPHYVDGELVGFKLSPGKDRKLFQELGLRRGDVVTSINGVSLTNIQDAMGLMNEAQSIEELNVEIQRKGESLSLLLNLNEKVGQ